MLNDRQSVTEWNGVKVWLISAPKVQLKKLNDGAKIDPIPDLYLFSNTVQYTFDMLSVHRRCNVSEAKRQRCSTLSYAALL